MKSRCSASSLTFGTRIVNSGQSATALNAIGARTRRIRAMRSARASGPTLSAPVARRAISVAAAISGASRLPAGCGRRAWRRREARIDLPRALEGLRRIVLLALAAQREAEVEPRGPVLRLCGRHRAVRALSFRPIGHGEAREAVAKERRHEVRVDLERLPVVALGDDELVRAPVRLTKVVERDLILWLVRQDPEVRGDRFVDPTRGVGLDPLLES